MNNADLRALYGLKYNPFLPALPDEALFPLPGVDRFANRVQSIAAHGGFALITGDPGHGKSKTLHHPVVTEFHAHLPYRLQERQ